MVPYVRLVFTGLRDARLIQGDARLGQSGHNPASVMDERLGPQPLI
jgi:hypothetical protein